MKNNTKIILLISLFASISLISGCSNNINNISQSESELISEELSVSSEQSDIDSIIEENKDFEGITFENDSFVYDGNPHSLEVKGAPSFANIVYTNNEQINVGDYSVKAVISAENYNTLTLRAVLSITRRQFEGIIFKSDSFDYDGNPHSIYVMGEPSFANVTYTNNNKSDVGTYDVTAKISAENYQTLTLKAKLTIIGKQFEGITFEDETIVYDGNYHSIQVKGAPSFANVSYSSNNKQYATGTYKITATITAKGYETLTLTAYMIIGKFLPKIALYDKTLLYTGKYQSLKIDFPYDLPSYTEATYKINGVKVSEENFKVKEIGTYNVSITLTNDYYNYSPTTTSAVVKVIENNVGGFDPNITPFTIDNNLKYKTLRLKILEGNFTIKYEYFDDYFYPDGEVKQVLSHTSMIYCVGGELFEFYQLEDVENNYLELTETYYRHTKIVNDEVKSAYFENGNGVNTIWDSSYVFPVSLYEENVIAKNGLEVMAWLDEDENGGFKDSEEGAYATQFGSYTIDTKNNCFIEDVVAHYFHDEFDHDEHSRYTIYNIGNTTLNVPKEVSIYNEDIEFTPIVDFYMNGFKYSVSGDYITMNPILDAVGTTYLEPGTYYLPAYVLDKPVLKFDEGYYDKYKDNDCSGYTFKFYFDNYGDYQGEYESLGYISSFRYIYDLEYDGATILFYGEW